MVKVFCLFFLFISVAEAKLLGESLAVNPYAMPGDSEMNHLTLPGIRFHEANDYFGKTDKLISGIGSLSVMEVWKHFSTSLTVKGRFIQPILKTRADQPQLTQKIGVYAESMGAYWDNSITIYSKDSLGLKLSFGFGYTDLGEHGLVNLYREIHDRVGSPVQDKLFGEKLKDNFRTSSYGVHLVFPVLEKVNFILGTNILNSSPLRENSYEASFIASPTRSFALSMKYMYIDQERSDWWNLTKDRQQFILALRLFSVWTPSLMYVSPYVEGDDYGQLYLSPISFTYPF